MKLSDFKELARDQGADNVMETFPVATFRSPVGICVTVEVTDLETTPDLEVVKTLDNAAVVTAKRIS